MRIPSGFSLLEDLENILFLTQKTSTSFAIELSEKFFNSLNPINAIIKGEINDFRSKQS